MVKFKATGINVSEAYGNVYISLGGAPIEALGLDKEKDYEVSIKPYRNKRSLSANAYCWILCERIAKELSKESYTSNEDVYRQAIFNAGIYRVMSLRWRDLDAVSRDWSSHGVGWFVTPSIMPYQYDPSAEIECRFYVGSSKYNTYEMARLIEHLIDECHTLGISTENKEYIDELLKACDEQKKTR